MKTIGIIFLVIYITSFLYILFVALMSEKEKKCRDCKIEMEHWDDKTIICPICKKGKKLW